MHRIGLATALLLGLSAGAVACGEKSSGGTRERGGSEIGDDGAATDDGADDDGEAPSTRVDAGGRARDAGKATSDAGRTAQVDDAGDDAGPIEPPACDATAAPTLPKLALEKVVTGVERLVYAAQPPGSSDWYLVQQTGQIRVLKAGESAPSATFLDVSSQIRLTTSALIDDERGLLGLAFAPDYESSGRFYVMMTPTSGAGTNRDQVLEYQRSSDPYVATPTPLRKLLELDASEFNHNGGNVVFGPDGMLYVGTGDGGGTCNSAKPGAPQQASALFGKLLRIDPKGSPPRAVHSGLRNPYRFSFDRLNGDLYIGDVGQDAFEELDFAPAGSEELNFGWGAFEATQMTCGGRRLEGAAKHTPPILEIDRRRTASGPFRDYVSVIGGHVYRGRAIPALQGIYLFGDYKGTRMGALMQCGAATSPVTPIAKNRDPNQPSAAAFSRASGLPALNVLTAIVADGAGELYLVAERSSLLKIVPGK